MFAAGMVVMTGAWTIGIAELARSSFDRGAAGANARNVASIELHRQLGFEEDTRRFPFPRLAFEGRPRDSVPCAPARLPCGVTSSEPEIVGVRTLGRCSGSSARSWTPPRATDGNGLVRFSVRFSCPLLSPRGACPG
jgi:hypothetical protein